MNLVASFERKKAWAGELLRGKDEVDESRL